MTPFCVLCGSRDTGELGQAIGICLDAAACHRRQAERAVAREMRQWHKDHRDIDWEELAKVAAAAAWPVIARREREAVIRLADRKRAVYCKPCDGKSCDYSDELAPFGDLLREAGP